MGKIFSLTEKLEGKSLLNFLKDNPYSLLDRDDDDFGDRFNNFRFDKFEEFLKDVREGGLKLWLKEPEETVSQEVSGNPSQGGSGDDVIVGDKQLTETMRLDEAILRTGEVSIDYKGKDVRLTTMGKASDGSGQVLRIRNGNDDELTVTVKIHGTPYSREYTIDAKTEFFVIAPQETGTFKVELETGKTLTKAGNKRTFKYGKKVEVDTSDDTLVGAEGNDTLIGGTGNDTLNGGAGLDTASYETDTNGITANLFFGTVTDGSGDTDTLISIENVSGSAFNDTLEGNGLVNNLSGNDGDDIIYTYNGNDVVNGGEGNDTLSGGNDDDIVNGDAGNDILRGDGGNDEIDGGEGDDQLLGHEGNDTLRGGIGNDDLRDGEGDDVVYGGDGNDTIYGGAGNDTYYGEAGDDFITAESGQNTVYGGIGADTLYGGSDADTIHGDADEDSIQGFDGDDTIYGGSGADYVRGNEGNDVLYGGSENDILLGDGGNDTISGDEGNDVINAGAGDDILNGGAGSDHLIGGLGADTYVFEVSTAFDGWDHIHGFNPAEGDTIDISDVLSNYNPLDHVLTDFVQMYESGTYTYLHVDVDGSGNYVRVAAIANVTGLGDVDSLAADGTLVIA